MSQLPVGLLGSKYIGGARSPSNLPDQIEEYARMEPYPPKPITIGQLQQLGLSQQHHLILPVKVTGKQFIVVCNSVIEYADTMEAAQAAAEKLAHQHQTEAFILKPVSKVAPKRDVVTTPITL